MSVKYHAYGGNTIDNKQPKNPSDKLIPTNQPTIKNAPLKNLLMEQESL